MRLQLCRVADQTAQRLQKPAHRIPAIDRAVIGPEEERCNSSHHDFPSHRDHPLFGRPHGQAQRNRVVRKPAGLERPHRRRPLRTKVVHHRHRHVLTAQPANAGEIPAVNPPQEPGEGPLDQPARQPLMPRLAALHRCARITGRRTSLIPQERGRLDQTQLVGSRNQHYFHFIRRPLEHRHHDAHIPVGMNSLPNHTPVEFGMPPERHRGRPHQHVRQGQKQPRFPGPLLEVSFGISHIDISAPHNRWIGGGRAGRQVVERPDGQLAVGSGGFNRPFHGDSPGSFKGGASIAECCTQAPSRNPHPLSHQARQTRQCLEI